MLLSRLSHGSLVQKPNQSSSSSKASHYLLASLPWVLILASAIIFIQALRVKPSDAQCFANSFSWSPASHEIEYHWETFENIDFFIDTPYFNLTQSDEIEEVWDEILPKNPIAIPSSRLVDLNHNSEEDAEWVRDPAGSESILALPEVFVQLGCINFLRQLSYSNERDYTHLACFQGGSSVVWQRAYQCLERLRQMVMCWADTSVILQEYDPDPPEGQEGRLLFHMDSYHRCRDFDRIKKWTENNAVENVTMNNLWWGGRMQE